MIRFLGDDCTLAILSGSDHAIEDLGTLGWCSAGPIPCREVGRLPPDREGNFNLSLGLVVH